ncbi:MAG: TIGR03936 family radical SAM-associated protein [Anaerovoracaceae bacterium]|jgi:radical SAM-linked protein
MAKYIMKFSKEGYIKYTSHLDMMRLFRRSFKRAGIDLKYSSGFNPHPKLSFAQPLSLGYTSICELMDFETKEDHDPAVIKKRMQQMMPEGITITECCKGDEDKKTLASRCTAAEYIIAVPVAPGVQISPSAAEDFLSQDKITALKKQKKKKGGGLREVDIKGQIRELYVYKADDRIFLSTTLDAGSNSNLSPELLLNAFMQWADIDFQRENVEILRKKIIL